MREALRLRSTHDRAIAALAIPALGSLVADPLLGLVDTAFIGRLGGDALAGLGVAAAIFAVAFFGFNFLEYGTTTEVASAVGRGDREAATRSVRTAVTLAVVLGLASAGLIEAVARSVIGLFGVGAGAAEEALTYIRIRALAAPAVLVVRAGHGAYRGYQDTRTPMVVTLVINGINLVLDPVLIFGAGWDIAGAAWATVIAQWIGAGWFLALLVRRTGGGFVLPGGAELRRFLRVGRDLAIRTAALLAALTGSTVVAARISDDAVAAHQVLSQLFVFLALGLDALAVAGQALVARFLGADDGRQSREVADRLVVLGFGVGVLLSVALALLAGVIPGWFTDEAAVIDVMGSAYWLLALSQPLTAVVFVWDGVFFGAGDYAYLAWAMVASATAGIGVMVAGLSFDLGLAGVWWGLLVLMVLRLVTLGWRRWGAAGPLLLR